MVHLLARYLEMRPLFLAAARPIKVEWKMRPYLGVLPRVFKALCGNNRFHVQHEKKSMQSVSQTSTTRFNLKLVCLNLLTRQEQCFQNKTIKYFLPLCCEWMLRLWGCTRTGGITLEQTLHLSSPVTLLSSSPALPSLQPRVFPSREGVPQYLNRAFSAPRI